jgi:hypothetical protein
LQQLGEAMRDLSRQVHEVLSAHPGITVRLTPAEIIDLSSPSSDSLPSPPASPAHAAHAIPGRQLVPPRVPVLPAPGLDFPTAPTALPAPSLTQSISVKATGLDTPVLFSSLPTVHSAISAQLTSTRVTDPAPPGPDSPSGPTAPSAPTLTQSISARVTDLDTPVSSPLTHTVYSVESVQSIPAEVTDLGSPVPPSPDTPYSFGTPTNHLTAGDPTPSPKRPRLDSHLDLLTEVPRAHVTDLSPSLPPGGFKRQRQTTLLQHWRRQAPLEVGIPHQKIPRSLPDDPGRGSSPPPKRGRVGPDGVVRLGIG